MVLEGFGLAMSIVALIQLTGKLTAIGYDYIAGVKRASRDYYIDKPGAQSVAVQQLSTRGGPIEGCIKDLIELQSKLGTREGLKGLIDNLGWPFRETETLQHITRIERYKSLFTFALAADQLSLSKTIKAYIKDVDLAVQGIDRCVQDTNLVVHETNAITVGMNTVTHNTNIVARNIDATVDSLRQDIRTDGAVQEEIRLAEKRKEVLGWLYPGAFDTKHIEISRKRQENTGGWIFELLGFQKWAKQESNSNTLCGYGIPGAGKIFLSSLVIDHFESLSQTENYGIAYIYFDYSDQNQQKPLKVERLHDKSYHKGKSFTIEDLYKALQAIQKRFSRVFLIFDALDECDEEEQRNELLPLFERMGTENSMNLFLTSRPYPEDIQSCFSDAEKIVIYAQEGDIRTYVEKKINENRRARRLIQQSKCKDRILNELVECAEGMFLLIRFHVEYICQQTSAKQVLTALDKIKQLSTEERPLDPTYDRAIQSINRQNKSSVDLALKVFSWLIKAVRVLTVEEIQVAVSIEPDRYELDELDLPDRATLLEVCAGLVTIDRDADTIRLAHYTVQEYLVENSIVPNADVSLAIACTTYLSFDAFAQGACTSNQCVHERFKLYPFLRYVAAYFPLHLSCCDENISADSFLKFLENPVIVSSWRQASHFSLQFICKAPIPLRSLPTESPLSIACEVGHTIAVQQLLEKGFDISEPDKGSRIYMYPLHFAAKFGQKRLTQFLLEKGADISALDRYGSTELHYAVFRGGETAQLLIDKGADVSATNDIGDTVLHEAVWSGDQAIVRCLIKEGADISALNWRGDTAIHIAIKIGRSEILWCLIEEGADLFAVNRDGSTVLHLAVLFPSRGIIHLLIQKGANISSRDKNGLTALHLAVLCRDDEIVRTFLDCASNADISALTRDKDTLLHLAVSREYSEEILSLLISKGVDISALNIRGDTALQEAVRHKNEKAIRVLLQHEATLEKQGYCTASNSQNSSLVCD